MLELCLIVTLYLAAALISLALLRSGLKGRPIPGCGAQSGCDAVQRSRWAHLGPVPVAALGVGTYLLLTFMALVQSFVPGSLLAWGLAIGAIFAGGGALWFSLLQLVVIRRFCRLCMIIHGLATSGCVLTFFYLSKEPGSALGIVPITVGVGGVLIMAFLQTFLSPRAFVFIPAADLPAVTPPDRSLSMSNQAFPSRSASATGFTSAVELVSGKVKLTATEWPFMGSPTASRMMAVMFDLTCEECRHLYRLLQETTEQHPDPIGFLMLPVPLHPACNPAACGKLSEDADACEFAKLYLAIWQRAPRDFPEFTRWLMAAKKPPSFFDARNRAQRILTTNVSLALVDNQVMNRLGTGVDLYRQLRVDRLPQILLEDRMLLGRLDSMRELRAVLRLDIMPEPAALTQRTNRS